MMFLVRHHEEKSLREKHLESFRFLDISRPMIGCYT